MLSGYALAFIGVRVGGALNEAGLRHVAYIVTAILYVGGAIAFARVFRGATEASRPGAPRIEDITGKVDDPPKGADGL